MTEMSHEEAFQELAAVALHSASPDVAEAVRAHAAVCPECGPELAAMGETSAMLGHLVPQAAINGGRSAGIRSRLVARARSEAQSINQPVALPARPDLNRGVASLTGLGHKANTGPQNELNVERTKADSSRDLEARARRFKWYAIAASIAFVAMGAQLVRLTLEQNALRDRLAEAAAVTPESDSLEAMIAEKEAMIAAMAGPDVKVVALTSDTARAPLGRMTWNRASNDWIMVTYGLRQPRAGMTYQVWLVTDDAKISAGTFRPDANGRTTMRANYALPRDALRAVAITEEPEGGVTAPTGPMVVSGSA